MALHWLSPRKALTLLGGLLSLWACTGDVDVPGASTNPNAPPGCVPQCAGRECGDDQCGGLCGACGGGAACNPVQGVCASNCGNGVIDPGETCDPPESCAPDCNDNDACTADSLIGTAESCSLQCAHAPITQCVAGDGCCAAGCNALQDTDCAPVCGNGVIEPGETCEVGGACPTACQDEDLCTEDVLVGSAETCNAACEFRPIEPCNLDYARGVQVGNLSVDQGIQVPIREGGQIIAVEERNGPLVARRPMLVRAEWVLDDPDNFTTRDIRAVLNIFYNDGNPEEPRSIAGSLVHASQPFEDVKETSPRVEPAYDDLDDAYVWRLPAESVFPGMRLSVELYEVDESFRQQPAPAVPPRFPTVEEDTFELGVGETLMTLEVVLVPMDHDLNPDCPDPPNITGMIERNGVMLPEYEYYRQRLMAGNPVENVTVIAHEPVTFTGSAESSSDVFTTLRQLREANDAPPWQFYYALVDPCDDGPSFSGVASKPSHGDDGLPDMNDASRRTGWGTYRDNGRSAGTFVHEIGHEQGRSHVVCGDPAGPDPDYPNDTGDIEVYGWDIFSEDNFAEPDDKDYMSYCGPSWVSRYGWNLMFPWIAEVSLWPMQQLFTTAEETRMLYATIQPGKRSDWWTGSITGSWAGEPSAHRLAFYAGQQKLGEVFAEEEEVHKDPGSFFLAAPVPEAWHEVTLIEWSDGVSQYVISRSAVREIR